MGLFDTIRSMFGLNNQHEVYNYRDADPHLEPDSDDSLGFRAQEFSYIYEMGDDFAFQRESAQPVKIDYYGLLKDHGADAIYLHYGFDNWDYWTIRTERMERQPDGGFSSSIPPGDHREINYCFKDSADHWDNNNGWNLKIELHQ